MPRPSPFILLLSFILASVSTNAQQLFRCANSVVVLLDSAQAASLNTTPDDYTREHTSFDLAIRLGHPTSKEEEYLQKAGQSVRNWPTAERQQLRKAFGSLDSVVRSAGLNLHMPDTIKMIKTTGAEEFGAEGWTRTNRIMLNTSAQPISLHLVAHELWHVISRYNPDVRNKAYAVFHFKPCNNIVYKPALNNKVITNPDCPYLLNYITVDVAGKPQDVALILYSKTDFQPGYTMDNYASIGLLGLTGDDMHKQPLLKEGKPVIYEISDVPDFLTQIGTNTQYIIHIEEITAEHFAALITGKKVPQMKYVEGVRKAL